MLHQKGIWPDFRQRHCAWKKGRLFKLFTAKGFDGGKHDLFEQVKIHHQPLAVHCFGTDRRRNPPRVEVQRLLRAVCKRQLMRRLKLGFYENPIHIQ